MIDSTPTPSGAVVDQGTARAPEPVVEADAGRQAEEAREDALAQAGHGARSVALQGEQVLAGPEDRLDALADGGEVRAAAGLVGARRTRHSHAEIGGGSGELAAGVALVADEQLTAAAATGQQFKADLTLIAPRIGQLERPGRTVGGGQEVQAKAPEPARVGGAVAVAAELGRTVAALLDVEEPVDAVTTGSIRHELRPVGVLASVFGRQLDPSVGDLAVTAGWGHGGKGGVTMPGRGRALERPFTGAEVAAFREGLADLGLTYDQLTACLGGACYDVYLNDVAYWRCVPARVWEYTIGGYQVMKKWLSYRERPLLGRDLQPDEARYVTEMTRRIAAILLLEPALDESYERVKADTYDWNAVAPSV